MRGKLVSVIASAGLTAAVGCLVAGGVMAILGDRIAFAWLWLTGSVLLLATVALSLSRAMEEWRAKSTE